MRLSESNTYVKRPRLLVFSAGIVILLAFASSSAGLTSRSLTLTVYADGYVHVRQSFAVDPNATSVQVPLLSAAVSDLVATDQNGSPLSYGFASGGSNLTVYSLGASSVTLAYDTSSLTSKNGTVWTLTYRAAFNSTVVLPPLSTLTSASGVPALPPYTISKAGTSPELTLPAGNWDISYGVPFVGVSSTTVGQPTTYQTGASSQPGAGQVELAAGALAAAFAVGVAFALWRRRRYVPNRGDLRPDDVQVLGFIREKGGKVLEPEIRTRFALPKTSAWRQIKRLERMGYVKVTKVGSQNQIELVNEREARS
ncbi:MAG: hypothetical protein JRN16_07490 [Nitrososphaerota archaeon]|nr:hypothetical protein [Nitrososphaerota archaeon]MDG6969176.1 hypothetical protein [Nitrososphaerota archaeon]MDG6971944.1 hypothetical protein [Nitrososphaerota archaeon]MDG6976346.1 hypothetical protein [Nitrososphaerota archaeon]MDG6981706.1 hypothetical protein [Nitrososphaerota archaeon]